MSGYSCSVSAILYSLFCFCSHMQSHNVIYCMCMSWIIFFIIILLFKYLITEEVTLYCWMYLFIYCLIYTRCHKVFLNVSFLKFILNVFMFSVFTCIYSMLILLIC